MPEKRDTYLLSKPCGCVIEMMQTGYMSRKQVDARVAKRGWTLEVLSRHEAVQKYTESHLESVGGCPHRKDEHEQV